MLRGDAGAVSEVAITAEAIRPRSRYPPDIQQFLRCINSAAIPADSLRRGCDFFHLERSEPWFGRFADHRRENFFPAFDGTGSNFLTLCGAARIPDAVRISSCRSVEPGPVELYRGPGSAAHRFAKSSAIGVEDALKTRHGAASGTNLAAIIARELITAAPQSTRVEIRSGHEQTHIDSERWGC